MAKVCPGGEGGKEDGVVRKKKKKSGKGFMCICLEESQNKENAQRNEQLPLSQLSKREKRKEREGLRK